jgi:hypothetical protein
MSSVNSRKLTMRVRPRRKPRSSRSAPRSVRMTTRPRVRRTGQNIAQSIVTHNMSSFRQDGAVSHRTFGKGYRFSGEQLLFDLTTDATSIALFGSGVATPDTANTLSISFTTLGGRLALMSSLYSRYRFTSLDFEYEPLCASTQAGGFCLAYNADSYVPTTLSYGDMTQFEPSVVAAFRSEKKVGLHVSYNGDECKYVTSPGSAASDVRLTAQGMLFGAPSSLGIGVFNQGLLRLRYVVEFYSPTSSPETSLGRLSPDEFACLSEKLRQLRVLSQHDKGVKETLSVSQSRCSSCSTSSSSSASAPTSTV